MTYHDSLWKDAPVGATHWIESKGVQYWAIFVVQEGNAWAWQWDNGTKTMAAKVTYKQPDIHPRPIAYIPAAQLVDQYRKEHGAEIDDSVRGFLVDLFEDGQECDIDHLLDDAAFHLALLDRYLAAERARVEGAIE